MKAVIRVARRDSSCSDCGEPIHKGQHYVAVGSSGEPPVLTLHLVSCGDELRVSLANEYARVRRRP